MLSVFIYWLAIRVYASGVAIASLFNPKAKLFVKGRRGLLNQIRYVLINETRPRIWMHCASLGEFEQGRPVLECLRKEYSSHAIVLTFFSPSGYEVRKNYEGADYVFYLPLDSAYNAAKFIRLVQPKLCLFVKYDLWYFMLMKIAKIGTPLILISAIFRKDQPFFKWYGRLHRRMLHAFTHIFVQDAISMQLLERAGVEHVSIGGDTRFDRVVEAVGNKTAIPEVDAFVGDAKVLVAGSTWGDDEQLLHGAFQQFDSDWKLIIAPHEINESHIKQLTDLFGSDSVLWSEYSPEMSSKRVLIVDTIGLLLRLYDYADIAYLGGGFTKSGIHNILEAAVYGVPIAHGPNYGKFKEAADMIEAGASHVVNNAEELSTYIDSLMSDKLSYESACSASGKYVMSNTGATGKIMNYLSEKKLLSSS